MLDIEKIKSEIIEQLKPLNPDKIILFGSYAYGTPNVDSDIDLYIVTNDDFIPQSYDEKIGIKLKVARIIDDLRNSFAIDMVVHTRPMAKIFEKQNSSFYKEIINKGIILL